MNTIKLIGLCGFKQAGKTTVANMLKNKGFYELSFAAPLKEACRAMYGLSDEQLYGEQKEQIDPYWGVTPREILQRFGTDVMRKNASVVIPEMKEDNMWIEVANRKIKELRKSGEVRKVCVSDVRFPNEAEWIRQQGGTVIRIDRGDNHSEDAHESEQIAFVADYDLDNSGTLQETERNLCSLLSCIYCEPFLL